MINFDVAAYFFLTYCIIVRSGCCNLSSIFRIVDESFESLTVDVRIHALVVQLFYITCFFLYSPFDVSFGSILNAVDRFLGHNVKAFFCIRNAIGKFEEAGSNLGFSWSEKRVCELAASGIVALSTRPFGRSEAWLGRR